MHEEIANDDLVLITRKSQQNPHYQCGEENEIKFSVRNVCIKLGCVSVLACITIKYNYIIKKFLANFFRHVKCKL